MGETQAISTRAFSKELRQFSYDMSGVNGDFKRARIPGIEVKKTFWLPVEEITRANGDIWTPFRKLSLKFVAERDRGKDEGRALYIYALSAVAERAIEMIPDHILKEIELDGEHDDILAMLAKPSEEDFDDEDDEDDEDDNVISESTVVTFETSDLDLSEGEINVGHSYNIAVNGDIVYDNDDDTLLYPVAAKAIKVPREESSDGSPVLFVPERVSRPLEDIRDNGPIIDYLMEEIAYYSIVDPFSEEVKQAITGDFSNSASRMRVIMDVLKNGVNVDRLHNIG
jgi:hypothetical protein